MAKVVGLPKLSPTMEEGTLVRWVKNEGDTIEVDDLVAEVETDKATMEFRSFDKGVLLKQLAAEGATLKPDQPVMIFGKAGEDISGLLAQVGAPAAASPSPAGEVKAVAEAPAAPPSEPAASGNGGRVLASPLVRKLARERDIDLTTVHGSGPGGRVVKRDVESPDSRVGLPGMPLRGPSAPPPAPQQAKALAPEKPAPQQVLVPSGQDRVEKVSQMRKTIARRLTESKQNVPHFYLTVDVDAEPLVEARAQINADLAATGEKISINDLVIKACAVALRRFPQANASFNGDTIVYHGRVDISVAVAIADGLVTPVVRNADQLGVLAISQTVRELATRAKDKKLKPEEMQNGTFSISNLGMFGIDEFSAVINPPEGAILAVSAIRDVPVVKNGAVVPGKRMALTMSCDHRVIDGAIGAQWLKILRGLLEAPLRMLV